MDFFSLSATPFAFPPPRPSIFFNYSFWVHHPVNRDDRHLLAHAMASDFSVTWQCLSKRAIFFLLRIKLHALIRLGMDFLTGCKTSLEKSISGTYKHTYTYKQQKQGCQMVYFQTKNPYLSTFLRALHRLDNVDIFFAIWNILRTIGKFYDHLVHFVLIRYIFPVLVSRTKKNLATLNKRSY
jgi:hypothetical protein